MNQPVHSCLLGLACPAGPLGLTPHTQALHKHKEPQNLESHVWVFNDNLPVSRETLEEDTALSVHKAG